MVLCRTRCHATGQMQPRWCCSMLVAPVFTLFAKPNCSHGLSRPRESEADDFAAAQTDLEAPDQRPGKMYRDNASTLTFDLWYSPFHHSHPPAPVRIANLSSKIPA